MSLGNYNPHTRYKERAAQRLASTLGWMAVILISVLIGFWMGKQFSAQNLITLKNEKIALTEERDNLQKQVTELVASAQTANVRYEQLQEEVETVLPAGPVQDLLKLVREQLDEGMDPQRLSFLIRSARPPTGCVDPESKRFVVDTPANQGPDSLVNVAEGAITVKGSGVSAQNEKGEPEAWYDPAKSVVISFTTDGKTETRKGILPIKYSIVTKGREYRFTIEPGARSFAKVVFDSCAYP